MNGRRMGFDQALEVVRERQTMTKHLGWLLESVESGDEFIAACEVADEMRKP